MPIKTSNFSKTFANEKTFEATFEGEFTIPLLADGEYFLVAYIATQDEGIRVTKPIAVEANVTQCEISSNGSFNKIFNEGNRIKIYSQRDSTINITLNGEYTYESLYNKLTSFAYNSGLTTNDSVEKLDGTEWILVNENDKIINGTYRLKYLNNNKEAYIVANLEL